MVVHSVLKSLLLPPGILILMLVVAFILARGVLARLLIFGAAAMLTLVSLPVVATLLMVPLEPYPALDKDSIPQDAQAILVLGAGRFTDAPEYGGDTVDSLSLQRARYAAYLHRLTGLPIYIAGGSPPHEQPPLGVLMAQTLESELGVPVAGMETQSLTSWENAANAKPMLERDGIRHVLLVTSAWHLPRAIEAFERAGVRVTPAPTGFNHRPGWEEDMRYTDWLPSARAFLTSYYALHEHLGRVWYQVRYWTEGAPRVAAASG